MKLLNGSTRRPRVLATKDIATVITIHASPRPPSRLVKFFVLLLVFISCFIAKGWGQSISNGGFETGDLTSWAVTGAGINPTASSSILRTGAYSMKTASYHAATFSNYIQNVNSVAVATNGYLHIICWARSSNTPTLYFSGSYSGTIIAAQSPMTGSSTFAQFYGSVPFSSAGSYYPDLGIITSNGSSSVSYIDDIVAYADLSATTDITTPNVAPTSLASGTITSSTVPLTWTNGSDAGTGVQGSIILRAASTVTTSPTLNSQSIYSVAGGASGPNTDVSSSNAGWTIVGINSGSGTTFTDNTIVSGTTYKYAVINYDLAFNYGSASSLLTVATAPTNYYWNGSNTGAYNNNWNNSGTYWSQPTALATLNAAWPTTAGLYNANFNSATYATTVTIPGTIAFAPSNVNIGTNNYTFTTTGSTVGTLSSPITLGSYNLTLSPISTANLVLSGIISQTGSITKSGAGTATLSGVNTYTGATSINTGTLLINGSTASGSAFTIAASTTLGGTGTVNGTVLVSGIISPNTQGTIGTLNTGNLTLGAGGTYYVDINGLPSGTAGTNWDNLKAGTITNSATSLSNFTVSLNGTIASFVNSSAYTWAICTYTGTAPSTTYIAVSSSLTNTLAGSFSIAFSSGNINLVYTPLSLPVITSATTANNNYGTAGSYTITASNSPTSYSTSTLPTGFSLSSNVITISAATVAGSYSITVNGTNAGGTGSATLNYTVNKTSLSVTGSNQSKTYGSTLSLGTTAFTTGTLYNGDAISSVTLTNSNTSTASSPITDAVGGYSIIPTIAVFSSGSSNNYTITYTNGTFTVNAGAAGTWLGITNTNFSAASNWANDAVQSTSASISIPSGTTYGSILSANTTVGNLTIASGATLSLGGNTLTINGAVSGGGTLSGSPTSGLIIGGTAGTINFTTTYDTLQTFTLNSSATVTLSNQLNIVAGSNAGTVTIASGATLTTNGNLILLSDINGTARIAQSVGSITGNVTVQRYISAKAARRFTFIGSAVSGVTIGNAWQQQVYITGAGTGGNVCSTINNNGFDVTQTNTPSMFLYNATPTNGSRYVSVPNTNTTNLSSGIGYVINIRGDRNSGDVTCANQLETASPTTPEAVTLSATGTVTIGDLSIALNDPSVHPYTLLANPYPSQLSFSAFQVSNSNTYNNMWTFSPMGNGNYATYSAGVLANGASSYNNTNGDYIASGQAFFVQANTNGNVIFHESHKTSGALPNTQYFGSTLNKLIRVGLKSISDSSLLDEIVLRYNVDGTKDYNPSWDATSFSDASQALVSFKDSNRLAIATHLDSLLADTAQLGISSNSIGTFRLFFNDFDGIDSTKTITLLDNFLFTNNNLRANPVYDFNVTSDSASVGNNRFAIILGAGNNLLPVSVINISATKNSRGVAINWEVAVATNITSYIVERSVDEIHFSDIITEKATSAAGYYFEDVSIPTSTNLYFRIKSIGEEGSFRYSPIAKLTTNHLPLTTISINPNPVQQTINVFFSTATSGNYSVRILTGAGVEVFNREGVVASSNSISLDANHLARGMYLIELTDETGYKQLGKFVKN